MEKGQVSANFLGRRMGTMAIPAHNGERVLRDGTRISRINFLPEQNQAEVWGVAPHNGGNFRICVPWQPENH